MKLVEPKVILLAKTRLDSDGMETMLESLGVSEETQLTLWNKMVEGDSPGEMLIELAGRMCYKSFEIGLNPNVTKIRSNDKEYFANILKKGDGSILEHVQVSFAFLNVSRIFTHELVRHRVGVAISQESMRFVRPKDIGFWFPPGTPLSIATDMEKAIDSVEEVYRRIESYVKWDELSFDDKKELSSLIRRILPDGIATNIVWSANLRTLRHVISMRTDPAAEIEIRTVFAKVAEICIQEYPLVFQDFVETKLLDGTSSWKPTLREKV